MSSQALLDAILAEDFSTAPEVLATNTADVSHAMMTWLRRDGMRRVSFAAHRTGLRCEFREAGREVAFGAGDSYEEALARALVELEAGEAP